MIYTYMYMFLEPSLVSRENYYYCINYYYYNIIILLKLLYCISVVGPSEGKNKIRTHISSSPKETKENNRNGIGITIMFPR